ncbi:SURF1 family protein [Hahella ganghwensis]|uniref:SURF1 family protein n=1 Tax=Hahella ganghwensis TaxID=286420 RepID=UPI0012FBC71A|nr:SURF1 family protein [Hahella ganghwensis]
MNWKLWCLFGILFPALLGMGAWQLQRADEKKMALERFHDQIDQPPRDWMSFLNSPIDFAQVRLEGGFLDQDWLLDNQIEGGRFGYRVFTPFCLNTATHAPQDSKECVLVDRGWVAGNLDRNILPAIDRPEGNLILQGRADHISSSVILGESEPLVNSPYRVQQIEIGEVSEMAGVPLSSWILRLLPGQRGVYKQNWQPVVVGPEKHIGYAVQWFAMAIVLAGLVAWLQFKPEKAVMDS